MTFEAGLLNRLTPICADVFPLVAPRNPPLPCLTYQRIDTKPLRDLDGTQGAWVYLQINAYSTRYIEARQLADAIRLAIEPWSDDIIQSVEWITELEDVDQTTETDIFTVKTRFALLGTVSQ